MSPKNDHVETGENAARKAWMSLLAKSKASDLNQMCEGYQDLPAHDVLRAPQIGSVMVQGRAGAVGSAFNLGEMTVTRCSIRLKSGETGHGYVQGRDKRHALQAAMVDALMQTEAAEAVQSAILAPLSSAAESQRAARSAKAAATKVDFFTMARGED